MNWDHLLGARDETFTFLPDLTAARKTAKNARRHFTEVEKQELIEEDGTATNADKLDLEGTHYMKKSPVDILMSMPFGL